MTKSKVFIVHGNTHEHRDKLVRIVADLGLEPLVLEFAKKGGRSIYEEFLILARTADFAFVLLTPDDKISNELSDDQKYRSRQNVIFEMGWFFAKLGRLKTRLLYSGVIEIPSDITGVIYIKFEDDLNKARSDIRDALEVGGLI